MLERSGRERRDHFLNVSEDCNSVQTQNDGVFTFNPLFTCVLCLQSKGKVNTNEIYGSTKASFRMRNNQALYQSAAQQYDVRTLQHNNPIGLCT
jgi:hypothetical protein